MPSTVTVDKFVERFPQFEGQDEQIEALILEASRQVDDTWEAGDIDPAIMYLVAHMIVAEETGDSLPVTAERLGPISVSYAAPPTPVDPLSLTEYGRRFIALRKQNKTGPVVV